MISVVRLNFAFNGTCDFNYKIIIDDKITLNQKNYIDLNEVGNYKIKAVISKKPKIRNKLIFDFKYLIPYFYYDFWKEVKNKTECKSRKFFIWDNYFNYTAFEFNISLSDNDVGKDVILLNFNLDMIKQENYCGSHDYFICPDISSDENIEISEIQFDKSEILADCNYKRNQIVLLLIKCSTLFIIGILLFMLLPDFKGFSVDIILTLLVCLYSIYLFVSNIIKMNRYLKCLNEGDE